MKFYAFTNEYNGKSYKNYHVFSSKKERDDFVKANGNAFPISAKEFKHDIDYINRYSDVFHFSSEIIEH